MTKSFIISVFISLSFISATQGQNKSVAGAAGHYLNPIFAGDYADPSILRDGKDYYMVHLGYLFSFKGCHL
jgi:xylan 1,4-beta-xylosidase